MRSHFEINVISLDTGKGLRDNATSIVILGLLSVSRRHLARMDALNRHFRSEAGLACARIVERGRGGGGGMGNME